MIVNVDNTQTGHIEIRQLGIVPLPHRRLRNGNSTKEEISIMKPKQIIISILAVLFVFPLMGTFAHPFHMTEEESFGGKTRQGSLIAFSR